MRPVLFCTLVASMLISATAKAEHESPIAKLLPPDDQSKVRAERPLTIGVPLVDPYNLPGQGQYRPTPNFLLGVSYDSSITSVDTDLGNHYEVHPDQSSAALYFQYYPIKSSGFYLGLGAEERFGSFTVHKIENGNDQLTARGTYQAFYAGPCFGMTWMWNNGLTLGFDFSKRKRFTSDATLESYSAANPATLKGDVQHLVTPDTILGTFMLGYSF